MRKVLCRKLCSWIFFVTLSLDQITQIFGSFIQVDYSRDSNDGDCGASSTCNLRAAILQAKLSNESVMIRMNSSVKHEITLGAISIGSASINISSDISGQLASISGTGNDATLFTFDEDASLSIEHLSVTAFKSESSGGVFSMPHASNDLYISDSTFSNNSGTDAGVVHADGGSVWVKSCLFEGNRNGMTSIHGGAITVISSGFLQSKNSTYVSNYGNRGGAIRCANTQKSGNIGMDGECIFIGDRFDSNIAEFSGGGINVAVFGRAQIQDCIFTKNSQVLVAGYASAISVGDVTVAEISNCRVEDNNAQGSSIIYTDGQTVLTMSDCVVRNNSAVSYGGVFVLGSAEVNISSSFFDSNECTSGLGGAVSAEGDDSGSSMLSIWNSSFTNNYASEGGGAIYMISKSFSIKNSSFLNNKAGSTYGGGTMRISGTSDIAEIKDCNVKSSTSSTHGGAMVIDMDLNITDTTFENCTAQGNGGALAFGISVKATLNGASFSNNNGIQGGALYLESLSEVSLRDCKLERNTAEVGGALYGESATLHMQNSSCSGNEVSLYGGAIFAEATQITGNKLQVVNNVAKAGGGSFLTGGTSFTGFDLDMESNSAILGSGGAVYAKMCELFLNSSVFLSNDASQGNGGGIHLELSTLEATGLTFKENNALNGGAFDSSDSESIFLHSNFSDNEALVEGGALYFKDSTLSFDGLIFNRNTAKKGGAIFALRSSEIRGTNSKWEKNVAAEDGGAVYLVWNMENTGLVIMEGCSFLNNSAYFSGGGILAASENYNEEAAPPDVRIIRCSFSNNFVNSAGGGMYLGAVDTTVKESDFSFNSASTGAGAVLYGTDPSPSLNVSGCKFLNNTASTSAGAMLVDEYLLTISDTTFSSNHAPVAPACSISSSSSASISSVNFTSNTISTGATNNQPQGSFAFEGVTSAKLMSSIFAMNGGEHLYGGAISIQDSTVDIISTDFLENRGRFGGAIYVSSSSTEGSSCGKSLSISDSLFDSNQANVGGTVYWDGDSEPCFSSVSMTDNTARLYGDTLASSPKRLLSDTLSYFAASGSVLDSIEVCFVDFYNSTVTTQVSSTITATKGGEFDMSLSGNTVGYVQKSDQGCTSFTDLTVTADPTSVVQLKFLNSEVDSLEISVWLYGCEIGYILPFSSQVCIECGNGYYTWSNNGSSCNICPDGAACFGGNHMKAQKGYWRLSNQSTGICDDDDNCGLYSCTPAAACGGVETLSSTASILTGTNVIEFSTNVEDEVSVGDIIVISGQYLVVQNVNSNLVTTLENFAEESETSVAVYLDKTEMCHPLYEGNACSKCITGYAKSFTNTCEKCQGEFGLTIFILVLGFLAIAAIAILLVYLQVQSTKEDESVINIYGKILLGYCQMLSLLSAFQIPWPSSVERAFEVLDLVSFFGDKLLAVNCLLSTNNWDFAVSKFYAKFGCFMIIPVLSIAFPALIFTAHHYRKKRQIQAEHWDIRREQLLKLYEEADQMDLEGVRELLKNQSQFLDRASTKKLVRKLKERLNFEVPSAQEFKREYLHNEKKNHRSLAIATTCVFLFLCHPNITKQVFLGFTCEELETEVYYLSEDLDWKCYTPKFWIMTGTLVIPCLLIFVFGIPILGFLLLYQVRNKLDDKHVYQKLSFLYKGFQKKYYYWEVWIIFRKIVLIFISVVVVLAGEMVTALTGFLATSFFLVVQLRFKPYQSDRLNGCESFGLACVVLSYFCGLYFMDDEVTSSSFLYVGFTTLIFLINAMFLLYLLHAFGHELIYKELPAFRERLRKDRERKKWNASLQLTKAISGVESSFQSMLDHPEEGQRGGD